MRLMMIVSLILLTTGAGLILMAALFQSQDIGSCPPIITGHETCITYYPGTNIAIEPMVISLVTLASVAFVAGAATFKVAKLRDRRGSATNP